MDIYRGSNIANIKKVLNTTPYPFGGCLETYKNRRKESKKKRTLEQFKVVSNTVTAPYHSKAVFASPENIRGDSSEDEVQANTDLHFNFCLTPRLHIHKKVPPRERISNKYEVVQSELQQIPTSQVLPEKKHIKEELRKLRSKRSTATPRTRRFHYRHHPTKGKIPSVQKRRRLSKNNENKNIVSLKDLSPIDVSWNSERFLPSLLMSANEGRQSLNGKPLTSTPLERTFPLTNGPMQLIPENKELLEKTEKDSKPSTSDDVSSIPVCCITKFRGIAVISGNWTVITSSNLYDISEKEDIPLDVLSKF